MEEILDLRQLRPAQLEPLLAAEVEDWRRDLLWDYGASLSLIRQYLTARVLTGYGLVDHDGRGTARGYGFYLAEDDKAILGDLYVHPEWRDAARSRERLLLAAMLETLQATPGLSRIEAQLMPFRPAELRPEFLAHGFRAYSRGFFRLELSSWTPDGSVKAAGAGLELEPWSDDGLEESAALIHRAYAGSIDATINDHYRTEAGALRFLHNVTRFPGCGAFDAACSWRLRRGDGRYAGLVLVSRVEDGVAHITQICVLPEARGGGLGRRLLSAALNSLRLRGYRISTLTVTSSNASAVTLYRRMGYREWRDFDAYVWEGGREVFSRQRGHMGRS